MRCVDCLVVVPGCVVALALAGCVGTDAGMTWSPQFAAIELLAPNWEIETREAGPSHYRITLTMKRFTTGGDGEAYLVMMRTAEQLRQAQGAQAYSVAEFSEGIESTVPVARRVARAVVELR